MKLGMLNSIENNGVLALISCESETAQHSQSQTSTPVLIKQCGKCNIIKNNKEFNKSKTTKDGYQWACRLCQIEEKKEYRKTHKKEEKLYRKQYVEKNREREQKRIQLYHQLHKEEEKEYHKKYRQEHKEHEKQHKKIYRLENKIRDREKHKLWTKTPKGRELNRKNCAKHRKLGFEPRNEWFEGCVAHHHTNKIVVHIPETIHTFFYTGERKRHRKLILHHYGSIDNMGKNAQQLSLISGNIPQRGGIPDPKNLKNQSS